MLAEQVIGNIDYHLKSAPGFVGEVPHPAFAYLREETNPDKLLRFFWGYANEQPYMSYHFLPALAELSLNLLKRGYQRNLFGKDLVGPYYLKHVQAIINNLSEEIIDPDQGEPHVSLSEILRRQVGRILGQEVESGEDIYISASSETKKATKQMKKELTDTRTGLLSLTHAERWMVLENQILYPAAIKAGIPEPALGYFPANMNADGLREDGGHVFKSAQAVGAIDNYFPIPFGHWDEIFDRSSRWRIRFWDQWEKWVS